MVRAGLVSDEGQKQMSQKCADVFLGRSEHANRLVGKTLTSLFLRTEARSLVLFSSPPSGLVDTWEPTLVACTNIACIGRRSEKLRPILS